MMRAGRVREAKGLPARREAGSRAKPWREGFGDCVSPRQAPQLARASRAGLSRRFSGAKDY